MSTNIWGELTQRSLLQKEVDDALTALEQYDAEARKLPPPMTAEERSDRFEKRTSLLFNLESAEYDLANQ